MLVFTSARFGWVGAQLRSPHMCSYFKGISMKPGLVTKCSLLPLVVVDQTEQSCCWWMRSWLSVNYWQCVGNQRKLVSILVEIISLHHQHNQSINQGPDDPHYRGTTTHYSLSPRGSGSPVNPGLEDKIDRLRVPWHHHLDNAKSLYNKAGRRGGFGMIGFDNLSGFVTFFPGPLSSSCDFINVNHFKSSTLWLTKLSIVNSELIWAKFLLLN